MGIINVTPDSFADGGRRFDPARAIADGLQMIADGADILDVGGESTRPGADPLPADEELRRVLPVVEALAADGRVPVSVDTYKASVARAAVARGAIDRQRHQRSRVRPGPGVRRGGDASGGGPDAQPRPIAGDVPRGGLPRRHRRDRGGAGVDDRRRPVPAGVRREAIIVDPGLGFAKRPEHTFETLARLDALAALDRPILSGPSRKSFLKAALGDVPPGERDWGTAAAVAASVLHGAHIVRVHDVRAMVDVVRVRTASCGSSLIRGASPSDSRFTRSRAPLRRHTRTRKLLATSTREPRMKPVTDVHDRRPQALKPRLWSDQLVNLD